MPLGAKEAIGPAQKKAYEADYKPVLDRVNASDFLQP